MNINYEYYKIFYYVAKTASISAAAKELCVSQPAVSQAVKSLEQAIGINLFIRTKKGVSLTGAGELLYKHVAEGYVAISMGEQQLARLMHLETGEIRIGASDMTLQFYLLPHLERFHQLYPGIKVHVTNAPTPSTIDHLFANNIDFGIVTTPLPQNPRNLGIGSIVADFAGDYIDRGEIFRLNFKKHIPKRNMCIISDRRRGMSIAAMKLMELL